MTKAIKRTLWVRENHCQCFELIYIPYMATGTNRIPFWTILASVLIIVGVILQLINFDRGIQPTTRLLTEIFGLRTADTAMLDKFQICFYAIAFTTIALTVFVLILDVILATHDRFPACSCCRGSVACCLVSAICGYNNNNGRTEVRKCMEF